MAARTLVFGIGNCSRGDDALGILLIERLRQAYPALAVLEVFQLQIEHTLDLCGFERVLFCDAALDLAQPCALRAIALAGRADPVSAFSHAMPPQALLAVYAQTQTQPPPAAFVLALRASSLALGAELSPIGRHSLDCGWALVQALLAMPTVAAWHHAAGVAGPAGEELPCAS